MCERHFMVVITFQGANCLTQVSDETSSTAPPPPGAGDRPALLALTPSLSNSALAHGEALPGFARSSARGFDLSKHHRLIWKGTVAAQLGICIEEEGEAEDWKRAAYLFALKLLNELPPSASV